ncbi:NAD-dependent dihydropyrimidine dehydrogenase subunit PreA [Parabacteroides johnsonii]|uniref:NAD-dependent dihydropyrimidine dehydrogenase subunit PreA n=1 Tax=Parabacteroides johnsonii TaxID=387661 RepID=UPI001896BFC3|nr:NAD-dependent dihydropyrimidine dehydrogenase subunit PreA [Parabacteroides johnsonii]
MKTKETILNDAQRCLMCHLPACDRACPTGTEPSGIIQSLHLENEEGARRQAAARTQCLTCEVPRCEQACARKHTDHALHIREICRTLVAEASHSCTLRTVDELPAQTPDLALSFCGVRCQNPFFLASSPVASSFDMCRRAFDAGWAGISYKTISFYHSREVSPRFDSLPASRPATFGGFKNLEQLSPRPAEENFDILSRLKAEYPEKVIIASIMGQTEEEWTRLARMAEEAGADLIECNFSCPQMVRQGLGSDIGQDPELIALYTRATRQGSRLPVIAKMTPNIGNMEPPAIAAIANGADALAAINTIKSITRIHTGNFSSYPDIAGRSAVGGYSGRAVKPIALRFVRDLAAYPPLAGVPLFGIGGITTWRDALDFLLLGCTAVQVCTAVMEYGYRIIHHLTEGLSTYMQQQGYRSVDELRGLALPHIVPPEQLDRNRRLHAVIHRRHCIGCGRCHLSCQDGGHQAIRLEGLRPEVDKSRCVGCGLCTLVCPTGACRLEEETSVEADTRSRKPISGLRKIPHI